MFEDFEARWKGLLTRASLKITEKLIVAIDKINRLKIMMQYSGCACHMCRYNISS